MSSEARRDILISRIAGAEATDADWDEFAALAERDGSLWREAIEAQRDQQALAEMMMRAEAMAEAVELPAASVSRRPRRQSLASPGERTPHRPVARLGAWTGWALAAMVMLAWVVGSLQPPMSLRDVSTGSSVPQQAGLIPVRNAQQAWDAYLDKGRQEGRVLDQPPRRVMLQSRPNPQGEGFEIIYVHQIMERAVVPKLYQYGGQDETGQPQLIRYEQSSRRSM